jgi:glycosyltransferase involved in cell wall biosynthesis
VLPNFLQVGNFDSVPANQRLLRQLRADDGVVFLTVGRVVPNKAIEDVVRIFYVYHRYVNPNSHLYIVGSRYLPTYDGEIDALVEALNVSDAVTLTGRVPLSDLKTFYQAADIYLTASYHEGFCVPLIECMHFGVPILARKAAAIPETLGDSGVLFNRLGFAEVAEMAHLLVTDEGLQAQVIDKQRERLRSFAPDRVEEQLWAALRQAGIVRGECKSAATADRTVKGGQEKLQEV